MKWVKQTVYKKNTDVLMKAETCNILKLLIVLLHVAYLKIYIDCRRQNGKGLYVPYMPLRHVQKLLVTFHSFLVSVVDGGECTASRPGRFSLLKPSGFFTYRRV